jgi:6-pyruvoyltetrahydropterin/6-carboxytetrahydropterin synthase
MKYYSTKTYGTDRGLSCCFRQWKANHSHCSLLHGYSIGIKLIFESDVLDEKNWCFDFGGLRAFKSWADDMFDHTLLVAKDDPELKTFQHMHNLNVCDLRVVDGVGCELFAKMCYEEMDKILSHFKGNEMYDVYKPRYPINPKVMLKSVEVFEHAGNSAIYEGI